MSSYVHEHNSMLSVNLAVKSDGFELSEAFIPMPAWLFKMSFCWHAVSSPVPESARVPQATMFSLAVRFGTIYHNGPSHYNLVHSRHSPEWGHALSCMYLPLRPWGICSLTYNLLHPSNRGFLTFLVRVVNTVSIPLWYFGSISHKYTYHFLWL